MIGGAAIAGVERGREGAATEWRQTGVGPTACTYKAGTVKGTTGTSLRPQSYPPQLIQLAPIAIPSIIQYIQLNLVRCFNTFAKERHLRDGWTQS